MERAAETAVITGCAHQLRALLIVALIVPGAGAIARAEVLRDATCAGCLLDTDADRRGLLVVLHGDDRGADAAIADWRDAARAAHLAVFAPECPRALGCAGSWWRWWLSDHHDPAWLARRIADVQTSLGLARAYVAGFSGGATYLGVWAPAYARVFPAIALVSGGAPMTTACPVAAQTALLAIGGDDGMLEEYVRPFADRFGACAGTSVVWQIVRGLGHHPMHRALADGVAKDVIAWLVARDPAPPPIVDAPLAWSPERERATLAYRRAHSDPDATDLAITPRTIVLHYTGGNSAKSTRAYFDQPEIEAERAELRRAGAVNVSSHFVVDRDGTIYQLQPPTRFARHCIGLNHVAIGIENAGDGDKWPLTDAQVAADAALIRELVRRYPITQLLAHSEVERLRDQPYYIERDPHYRNSKPDPGAAFMAAVRSRVRDLGLAGPEPTRSAAPR